MPSHELKVPNSEIQTQEIAALETRLKQIHASYQKGQWAQAITYCETVIAQCNQRLQRQSSAVQPAAVQPPVTESPSTVPPAAELYIAKGDLFSRQKKLADAIRAYEQALSLQPQQPELLKKVGDLYTQLAQKAKSKSGVSGAVRVYLQALQQHPRLFVAYNRLRYNLMRYEIAAGDSILAEIVQVCQKITTQDPSILPAQVTLGYALTKLGKREAATACYRQLSEQFTHRQLTERLANGDHSTKFLAQAHTPDFMIIGAEKCGTTSLHQYLRQHPQVLPTIEKEIDFFDMEYEQGIDWYLAHFPPLFASESANSSLSIEKGPGEKEPKEKDAKPSHWITGETSANYLYSEAAPERVFKHFPNIKLAVILRNPIDRSISRHSMMVRNGAEQRSFATAVEEEMAILQTAMTRSADGETIPWQALNRCRHLGNSLYYYHIKRWLALFPPQQLVVLRSEDLFAQPQQTLTHLYEALGLSTHTGQHYPKHNAGRYSPAAADIRRRLSVFFDPHTRKLETLLDRSFSWSS